MVRLAMGGVEEGEKGKAKRVDVVRGLKAAVRGYLPQVGAAAA